MTRKKSERPYRKLDETEKLSIAIKIAKLLYEEQIPRSEIAKRLNLRDGRVVNELIDYGRRQGVIKIWIGKESDIYISPNRNENLEKELTSLYQLDQVIVIDIPLFRKEDNIHLHLGRAMAKHLAIVIRSGDHIGVTGGRAMFSCAQAMSVLKHPDLLPQRGITITSLAGGISRNPEIPQFEQLSADNVALTMTAAFSDAISHVLSVPWIAFQDAIDHIKYPSERFIQEEEWENFPNSIPNFAVMGVGVLKNETHPFFYENKLELEPVKPILLKIKDCTQRLGYNAVGDLGQRFFVIEPPKEKEVQIDTLTELKQLVFLLNQYVVAITTNQLQKVKTIALIAGGYHKRQAIYTILQSRDQWPLHRLCTDNETAQWLVQQQKEYNK